MWCILQGMQTAWNENTDLSLTFWNAAVAGMQDAKKCRMHGMQNGARPQQPTCRPAHAQLASRASTAVKELVKLGDPGEKHQRPGTGSLRATGAA